MTDHKHVSEDSQNNNNPTASAPKTEVPKNTATPPQTEAQKIWEEIKDVPLQMFGLPSRPVCKLCRFENVEPTKLYVTVQAGATLPALETALRSKFTVESMDKYLVVSRISNIFNPNKKV